MVAENDRRVQRPRSRRHRRQNEQRPEQEPRRAASPEYVPLRKRKRMREDNVREFMGKRVKRVEEETPEETDEPEAPKQRTLIDEYQKAKEQGKLKNEEENQTEIDDAIVDTRAAFVTAQELAGLAAYETKVLSSSWRPPRFLKEENEKSMEKLREKFNIEVIGENVAPPITKFKYMKFPSGIAEGLAGDNIKVPTPIQMQALPSVLAGRDVIGIAYTGSGKTLVFALPMICFALEDELRMPYCNGEGPYGLIICPSRELAAQTHSKLEYFSEHLKAAGWPELRSLLCIGGVNFRDQGDIFRRGIHMVVATPGRLKNCLDTKKFTFTNLKYFCLDEADRLMDVGFEDDLRHILSYLDHQTQKVFFSATMPRNVRALAERSMVKPIVINVGRAGAANLDVIQEVEYVKDEAKLVYLLECLKKTPPPVLVFCSNQGDVDEVLEYLLLKGVETRAIHGNKDQKDRIEAVKSFKALRIDVLVATDVASKGLDFPDIRHVINYDMPSEIEDYIHRIGRTGRCGKTGVATTFINVGVPETTLLDLKGLLLEANQAIPPILSAISGGSFDTACSYCGGLGHMITDCPKLATINRGKNEGMVDDELLMAGY